MNMSIQNVLRRIGTGDFYNKFRIQHFSSSLSNIKDLKQQSAPDILMNEFKYANSTKHILDTVDHHERVMNGKHIMQALRTLFVLQKEGRSDLSTNDIIKSRKFTKLCRKLKSYAGAIELNETIEALKIVTYVGVPKDSVIVQVLLQLIRHNVNDLSLSHIIFLEFLLGQYSEVPLAQALKIALPIVFEIQLPVKLDRENLSSLKECLFYSTKNKLSPKATDLIISSMLKCKELSDTKTAKSIIWSLTELPPTPAFETLLKKNIQTLLVHMEDLTYDDLDITISKLSQAYSRDYPFFSDKVFCDSLVGYLIDRNLGYTHSIYLMRKLDRLGITNRYLINYVAKKIEEDDSLSTGSNIHGLYILMKYLSKTDYRPPNWQFLEDIMQNLNVSANEKNMNWLKVAASLCYLKIFNENILSKAMDENLEMIIRKRRSHVYLVLHIYHSLKLYKPDLMELVLNNIQPIDALKYLPVPSEFPLEEALNFAFGGGKYVKRGLLSREGIFIDHTIVFRKGGFPVAITSKSSFLEDLDVPVDNQVGVVMCLTPELFTEENYLKRGPALALKILEDSGYVTVPICLSSWNSLPDHERIPYLVHKVKNKLGKDMMEVDSIA